MSDVDTPANDRRSEPIAPRSPDEPAHPMLVMKPESFFSHRFSLTVEDATGAPPSPSRPAPRTGLERLIDLNLLLMILLIGVPVLAYCIFASPG